MMMSKDTFYIVKTASWVMTTGLCWAYAASGHSDYQKFELWFWGISFAFDLLVLTICVALWVWGQR